jgi:hypothetical protein
MPANCQNCAEKCVFSHTYMCDLHHRAAGYVTHGTVSFSTSFLGQLRVDRIEQGSAAKRLFEESYSGLQHFAIRHQFPGVT